MLDQNRIRAASHVLGGHWHAGTKLDTLESSLRPRTRAEGYAIQAALEPSSSGKRFGWKIAATSDCAGSGSRCGLGRW